MKSLLITFFEPNEANTSLSSVLSCMVMRVVMNNIEENDTRLFNKIKYHYHYSGLGSSRNSATHMDEWKRFLIWDEKCRLIVALHLCLVFQDTF